MKLQEANTKHVATFTVFLMPIAPPVSYSSHLNVGQGKCFSDRRGSRKPGGQGRGQGRSKPSATSMPNKPSQSKEGQATLTVSVPQDTPSKHKVEPRYDTSQTPRKNKRQFRGKSQVKSNEDVLPPQPAPVGGRLSEFVEGWKPISNDPYVLSIITRGYRLRFTTLFYARPPGKLEKGFQKNYSCVYK